MDRGEVERRIEGKEEKMWMKWWKSMEGKEKGKKRVAGERKEEGIAIVIKKKFRYLPSIGISTFLIHHFKGTMSFANCIIAIRLRTI